MKNSTPPNHFITVLLGTSLGFCQVSLAADTPQVRGGDAGALMQQNEQSIKPHLPNTDALRLLSLPPPMTLPEQFGMTVRRVYFLGNTRLSILQVDGKPLPNWLRYEPDTKTFIATDVPAGAFPLQLKVSGGGQETMMVIREQDAKR